MTAARKALKERLQVTAENRWKDPRTGAYGHLALKHLNFAPEEWAALNALDEGKLEERQKNRQLGQSISVPGKKNACTR